MTPIPEEVFLISLGFAASSFSLNVFLAGLAALAGLLTFDNALFFISMKGSKYSDRLLEKVNSRLLDRIEENLKTHAVRTLVNMALLPKLRFISPIFAGVS